MITRRSWGYILAELKVLTVVATENSVHWDITPASTQLRLLPAVCWFLAWLTLQQWRWRRHLIPKRQLIFAGLHGVISQHTITSFLNTPIRKSGLSRNYVGLLIITPVTVAARSKTWTVFARSNTGIVGSNPTRGMNICVCLFCV
jgi:hypothetical protein